MPPDLIEPHPDLDRERAVLRRAYACLTAMRDRDGCGGRRRRQRRAGGGRRHRQGPPQPPAPQPLSRRARAQLRPARRRGRRHLVRRAPPRGGRPRRPGRRRLAGAGVDALLPGHRERPARVAPAPAVPDDRHRARRPLRRGLRRPRLDARRPHATWAASPTRCSPSSSAPAPGRCATSWRRSRPSRTWSSAPRSTPAWSCRAGPGTGKTAVGLHRAAFLLYEHRELLDRDGVLVVGPEPGVPPLHRAGPPLAGRGGHPPDHRRAARRRLGPAGPGGRRTRAGPAPRRRPHGRGAGGRAARDAAPPDRGRGRRHRLGPADPHRRRPSARRSTRSSSGACRSRPVAPRCGPGCTGSRGSSTTPPGATARRRPTCSTGPSAAAPTSRPRSPASGRRPAAPPSPSGCSPAGTALAGGRRRRAGPGRAAAAAPARRAASSTTSRGRSPSWSWSTRPRRS